MNKEYSLFPFVVIVKVCPKGFSSPKYFFAVFSDMTTEFLLSSKWLVIDSIISTLKISMKLLSAQKKRVSIKHLLLCLTSTLDKFFIVVALVISGIWSIKAPVRE